MTKDDTTTLGTFRIDKEVWKSFQEKAKADGQNASAVLNRFIRQYLDGVVGIPADRESPVHLESSLEERIEAIVQAQLAASIANLEARIDELGKSKEDLVDQLAAVGEARLMGKLQKAA